MKTILKQILMLLRDGKFHSGEVLAQQCNVTRTTIWKEIKCLQALGLDVNTVRSHGYQIPGGVELLDVERISQHMTRVASELFSNIDAQAIVASTNDYLLERVELPSGSVCIAEVQSTGRGRRARKWLSPLGYNIYLSTLWHYECSPSALAGLSLAVGLVVHKVLQRFGLSDLQLKWPNDIYYRDQKLSGILLDVVGSVEGPCSIVLGIGINVKLTSSQLENINQNAIDINSITSTPFLRNQCVAEILNELAILLPHYQEQGFAAYQSRWRDVDYLFNQTIQLEVGKQRCFGVARGVADDGSLLVDCDGVMKHFTSGDVSVRKVKTHDSVN